MSSGSFKNVIYKMSLQIVYLLIMYKEDSTSNNLQGVICHKTEPNQAKPNHIYIYIYIYIYILVISSQRPKTVGVDYMRNII